MVPNHHHHLVCEMISVGNSSSILPLLEKIDQEGNKIVSFGSWRAWPRRRFIEYVYFTVLAPLLSLEKQTSSPSLNHSFILSLIFSCSLSNVEHR
jgi:hypothetical protein